MTTVRLFRSLEDLPAADWNALHDRSNPFVEHAFLAGLETTGCLRPGWGWTPKHLTLWDGDALIGAVPGYEKMNSHGEFVFDHAWAAAWQRYGRAYYPKWLLGVPYSPVTGPRLLARDDATRRLLLDTLASQTTHTRMSGAHINFLPAHEDALAGEAWLSRCDVQFHWRNGADGTPRWRDFPDFLDAFVHKRRKAIRQEREKVARAGFGFRVVHGDEATAADLLAMHQFYLTTFAEKGNSPALTLDFLRHLARTLPRRLVLILAERDGRTVAGALCLRGGNTLYGRYWGSDDAAPGLHFETCYYQGIDYCLREGLTRFEPGAQGEHKIARGFLPVLTHSRHFIADTDFADALRGWCADERDSVHRYRDAVLAHSPFRAETPAPP
ncbi:GNAT family N-acetyltransferase [Chiayiivirga flava]|uniref:N-acetyltransferase n=1 Tax=Chiayiivirga flava TaxID=659595 RepID=A0A7W8G0Y9_9GAMM|nr:GNAT family N-acetyltransferase [Chiayiivirga flava]MBB5208283.1 hypothetical protein [Chiayiivirga flava]